MFFRIHRRDIQVRFVVKFCEKRPLRKLPKGRVVYHTKNSRSAGLVPAPILPKMGRSRPKFPERCHPLTCPRVPDLVRMGRVLSVSGKNDFSAQKVNKNLGIQPTVNVWQ